LFLTFIFVLFCFAAILGFPLHLPDIHHRILPWIPEHSAGSFLGSCFGSRHHHHKSSCALHLCHNPNSPSNQIAPSLISSKLQSTTN
jgi:hypothetical protein